MKIAKVFKLESLQSNFVINYSYNFNFHGADFITSIKPLHWYYICQKLSENKTI